MNWQDEITAAANRIADHIQITPTVDVTADWLPCPVSFKLEQMQHTGTFKARGAFNSLLSGDLPKIGPKAGIVAASGGNHGAAVAYAAHKLGYKAAIFVPEMAGPSKIDLIRRAGADLRVVPGEYADALRAAQIYEADTGAAQIHAYDGLGTVVGQGTMMREWERQGLAADTVLIAVGGGGLIGGSLAWLQGARKVVAVEPETSCALNAALAAGKPVDVDVSGVAANALGAKRIGQYCFDLSRAHLGDSVLVSDDAITRAQLLLWQNLRQLVEPAGATALAALLSGAYTPAPGERVAVLICGANPAPDPLI